jgi:hypothetical protein
MSDVCNILGMIGSLDIMILFRILATRYEYAKGAPKVMPPIYFH